jgi:hypothetical protein
MATKKLELAPCASLAPELKALLGPPPLPDGEDASAFDAVNESIRSAVAPRDHLEEIWARNVVDILWETRGMSASLHSVKQSGRSGRRDGASASRPGSHIKPSLTWVRVPA